MNAAGSRGMLEVNAGNDRVFQFQVYSTFNQSNQTVLKTTIREVTAERRREQLLRSLLREVSHRSKNLLAIIQSLAGQTARFSLTKDDFLRKFRGRLHALAQSQDLITDSDWRGARIFELLRQQFDLYVPEYPNLIHMEGKTCCSIRMARSISGSPSMSWWSIRSAIAAILPIIRRYRCNVARKMIPTSLNG